MGPKKHAWPNIRCEGARMAGCEYTMGRVYFSTKDYFVSTKHAINYKLKALGPVPFYGSPLVVVVVVVAPVVALPHGA